MFQRPADSVIFAKKEMENEYLSLPDENWLKIALKRTIEDLKENIFCGKPIRKKQIPNQYIKEYRISNLWWYPLSNGWRLVYSINTPIDTDEVIAMIIEFFNHKDYERRSGYT